MLANSEKTRKRSREESDPHFPIIVERPDLGNSQKRFRRTFASDTVRWVKVMIKMVYEMPIEEQCLLYKGQELENERTLGSYNIQRESVLILIRFPNRVTDRIQKTAIEIGLEIQKDFEDYTWTKF